MDYVLHRQTSVRRDLDVVFPFFAEAANLQRLTPPELHFRIRSELPVEMKVGAVIEYTIRLYGIPMRWRTLRVVYALPFGALGRLVHPLVKQQLRRIFGYRTAEVSRVFAA